MATKAIPDGFHTVTPYPVVRDVPRLIEFLKHAFDAEEIFRHTLPDGKVVHAEVRIGDSMVMMGEAGGKYQPMPAMIHLYVNNADATYRHALQAGAASVRELVDEPYGDRTGGVKDPVGNEWWIATHKEDVHPDELAKRMAARKAQ